MTKQYTVAIVGATGAVGQKLLSILAERAFPIAQLLLFASPRSEGRKIVWQEGEYSCRILTPGCFQGVDFVFFDAADAISERWVPEAVETGAWVIDNSAAFRLNPENLLLVPEVNGHLLRERFLNWKQTGRTPTPQERVLSGPNCVAVPMTLPLQVLKTLFGLRKVIVSTYQSTSGAGSLAQDELYEQTRRVLNDSDLNHPKHQDKQSQIFPHPIAFNCIPQVGRASANGYTSEEEKIKLENQKILNMPHLQVIATAVRVPTFSCHAESLYVECEKAVDLDQFRRALQAFPGIDLSDDLEKSEYPMGVTAQGKDFVSLGRIRPDEWNPQSLCFWLVSDNLRKGAALNAVQIGELLLKELLAKN